MEIQDKEKLLTGETLITRDEHSEYKSSVLKEGEYTCKKITRTYVKGGKTTEEYDKLARCTWFSEILF